MFDFLTLSVVIDDKIFCVHGGVYVFTSFLCASFTRHNRPFTFDTFNRPDQGR